MSSRSRKLSMMPFLFHMIGGRRVPWMAQVRTALRPTVTMEMLTRWSSARLNWTTSVRKKKNMKERLVVAEKSHCISEQQEGGYCK